MRIDAHQHFWDPARHEYPWMAGDAMDPVRRAFTPADLRPVLRSADGSYGEIVAALDEALPELSPSERDLLYGGNAERAYRLSPAAG